MLLYAPACELHGLEHALAYEYTYTWSSKLQLLRMLQPCPLSFLHSPIKGNISIRWLLKISYTYSNITATHHTRGQHGNFGLRPADHNETRFTRNNIYSNCLQLLQPLRLLLSLLLLFLVCLPLLLRF